MSTNTPRAASDRLDDMMGAAARQCVYAEEPYLERVLGRAEGVSESADERAELDAHLDACAYCRRLLREHEASIHEAVPAWVGRPLHEIRFHETTPREPPEPRAPLVDHAPWRRKVPLLAVTSVAATACGIAAIALLSAPVVAPEAPRVGHFERQIATEQGPSEAEPSPEPDERPRYAITGTLRVRVLRPEEATDDTRIQAFTVDALGKLTPVPESFIERSPNWIGVRIDAPVARLFPDASVPAQLALCTSRVAAEDSTGRTIAEIQDDGDARCVVRAIEVVR